MADRVSEGWDRKTEMADRSSGELDRKYEAQDEKSGDRDAERMEEEKKRSRRRKRERHLTGSLTAKVAAFFLFVASFIAGAGATILCVAMAEYGFFSDNLDTLLMNTLRSESVEAVHEVMGFLVWGEVENAENFCQTHNIDMEISYVDEDNQTHVFWSTWSGFDSDRDISAVIYRRFGDLQKPVTLNGHTLMEEETYLFHVHIDPDFPVDDDFRKIAEIVLFLHEYQIQILGLGLGGILLFIVCFVFLMSSAGHRNGCRGIVPSVLTGIPLDVLMILFGGPALFFTYVLWENIRYYNNFYGRFILLALWSVGMVIWMTLFFMEFALRLKLGKCWKHTLVYSLLRGIWRIVRFLGRGAAAVIRVIPLALTAMAVFFGSCIVEFIGIVAFGRSFEGLLLWLMVKTALLVIIMYIVLTCNSLLKASRALAEGRENHKVDTSKMFGDFKEHGENLNSLGEGISKAVAERMKSEHLKTELITNVSHDIKTPLTSIINYADLIYEESVKTIGNAEGADSSSMARVNEYSQVLLRQSKRMKKLLEDLVEASKATTGNLEVNLEPCEAGVLLSQAVGEYQQKMEEKRLELIARQPQEPVKIMADGRHLWRVFDNLLNNICKYAQENTRVYLSLEIREGQVLIIFRNMSQYPLDIPADELEDRFVRGDKSRHMEGNGLGLSIAKSLVELQKGQMEIVIDGDLFKVILGFPLI